MNFKNKAKLKATLLSAAAIATSCLIGMSACSTKPNDDDDDEKTVTKLDTQLIKNGNFEFYDDKDGLYPISTPDNWTSNYSGNSSYAMGGVINTSKERWDYITDETLADTLEANNDLKSDDENKKDYNGALADDLPYKNTHEATKDDAKAEEKEFIANPFTHKYSYGEDGKLVDTDGKEVETYEKDGKIYIDKECTKELETSVLMLHNYRSSYFTGTETYYSTASEITLEARTAAKLSVWVKTCELYFDGTKNERTKVENEHGAYIQVNTTVGDNSLDSFYIRNINTEQLNPDNENNGWVQYTVYVQASSFASTTVSLTLGLGQDDKYTVEGYAFFDDIEMYTYENAAEMIEKANGELGDNKFGELTEKSTANLLSPDGESEFRVDKVTFKTNGSDGDIIDKTFEHNFADRHFYIDLTSSAVDSTNAIEFNRNSVAAGFTVEKTNTGRYVSSKNSDLTRYGITTLDNGAANAYLPSKDFNSRRVTDDILATIGIGGEDWKFNVTGSTGKYDDILTNALSGAYKLPGVENGATTALVMLSANGAAYEAELTNDAFKLNAGEFALLTFWVKTSDMEGRTAATVTVKDVNDDENTSSFTLDSTTVDPITINEKEDIYDGWVECFIRIENSSEDEKQFKLSFNFGNTTIKGTDETNYKAGWLAVANASVMQLDKDVYSYTSGLSNSASLTLSDTESKKSNEFDTEQGDKNVIKNNLAIPSSYTGVNGSSAEVININTDPTDYDETNRNPYAGLLNKEYYEKGNYEGCEWYSAITSLATVNSWNDFAGKYSVQPLLILNVARQFENKAEAVYNYGYIGEKDSVSSNGYTAVSVKVKASKGAIANVYLVDTDASSKKVLGFSMPKYTFWYDDEGNILKGEPKEKPSVAELKENIAYTLRADGLYENGDGKLYANFYNLKKFYDYDLEKEKFYDADGNEVKFENLVQGETYYANSQITELAPHYLVAGESDKVYKYNAQVDGAPTYYYMVSGKADTSKIVYGVDTEKAALRYEYDSDNDNYPYQFTIDTIKNPEYADKWVTVTFYLKAGSESKDYKLELWSGYRDEEYSGQTEGSYVLFDYNSESLSESSFKELVEFYTDAIINEYKKVITDEQDKLSDNITDYEKLAGEKSDIFNYDAKYYTYTLYDSDNYVPFNADTAKDNETGYAYNYSDYEESLAYLKVEDFDGNEYSMSAFVDYSNFDKDISLGTQTTVDGDETDNTTTSTNGANFWLLLASIILLAAIVIALLAIFTKDLIKKLRRNKTAGKNTYNFNKNKRYVRKYVKANGEITNVEEGNVDETLLTDKVEEPVEESPFDEAPAEKAETPVEEAPEEAPAEEANEAPAEQTPAEEANEVSAEENKGDEPDGENKE